MPPAGAVPLQVRRSAWVSELGAAMKVAAMCIGFLLLIVALGYYEAMVWGECLSDHSWFYCLRVLR